MTKFSFINTQLRSGVWEGDLTGAGATEPDLIVTHLGTRLEGLSCTNDSTRNVWRVRVPIPSNAISDGLQTFVVSDASEEILTSFSLLAGDALADDLRAEIDLLRSELDLLKKAFRRHCNES